jgi:hypothetical protein
VGFYFKSVFLGQLRLIDLKYQKRSHLLSKGNQVKIPEPELGYFLRYGNVNEPRDAGGGPEKSSLFFLTVATTTTLESDYPEIGLDDW